MSIERDKAPRPCLVEHLIATQLTVDPGQQDPKLIGWDQAKDIPQAVGTWLTRTHQTIQSLRHPQFGFDGMEAPKAHGKHPEGATPNR